MPALQFNGNGSDSGNDDFMISLSSSIAGSSSQTGYTAVVLVKPWSGGYYSNKTFFSVGRPGEHNRLALQTGWSGRTEQDQFRHTAFLNGTPTYSPIAAILSPNYSLSTNYLIICSYNMSASSKIQMWTNGSSCDLQESTSPKTISNFHFSGTMYINAFDSLTIQSASYAEVALYNRQLSVVEMQQIQTYVSQTYAISQSLITTFY